MEPIARDCDARYLLHRPIPASHVFQFVNECAPEIVFAYDDDLASARRIDSLLKGLRTERDPSDDDESDGNA